MIPIVDETARVAAEGLIAIFFYVGIGIFHRVLRPVITAVHLNRDAKMWTEIMLILAEAGTRVNADRAYLCKYRNGNYFVDGSEVLKKSRTHQWTRPGVSKNVDRFQDILTTLIQEENDLVLEEGPSFRNVAELPDSYFKDLTAMDDTVAIARCAIGSGKRIVGFIGIDWVHACHLPPPHIDELPGFAVRIGHVLRKYRKT